MEAEEILGSQIEYEPMTKKGEGSQGYGGGIGVRLAHASKEKKKKKKKKSPKKMGSNAEPLV